MKIFLVTMKSLPNDHVSERMKSMAIEAAATEENPAPVRSYTWLKPEDDADRIEKWRSALQARQSLLDSIGIIIQPDKTNEDDVLYEYKRFAHLNSPTFACTGEQLLSIMEVDDSVSVKSSAPVASDSLPGIIERMDYIVKKLEAVPITGGDVEHIYNEKCEVHMPGQALATYNDTLLLEDSCTDKLQEALNNGWRLIAACPQPDARRPDYILGRYNPDLAVGGDGARRHP